MGKLIKGREGKNCRWSFWKSWRSIPLLVSVTEPHSASDTTVQMMTWGQQQQVSLKSGLTL